MKFGIRYANMGQYVESARALKLVQYAENAGFDTVWTSEHVIIPKHYESLYPYSNDGKIPRIDHTTNMPEPLIWMTYCAASTHTIKFGTAVMVLPMRHPILLAKQAATFDQLSSGRFILGVGSGWLEEEFQAMGTAFEGRGRVMDQHINLIRHLWGVQDTPQCGSFDVAGLNMEPKPVTGSVPIHIGGDSLVAARRAGRLGDGYFTARGYTVGQRDEMWRAAEKAGRDPSKIEVTVAIPDDLSELENLARLGVSRVSVPVTGLSGLASRIKAPEELAAWADTIAEFADL